MPDFICGVTRYRAQSATASVEVRAGETRTVLLNYGVFASYLQGRVFYSRGWVIHLGFREVDREFNEVQWRIQTSTGDGLYESMPRDRWDLNRAPVGDSVQIFSLVPPQPNVEFRLVRRNIFGTIERIWYPPYTCGVDACSPQRYILLWNPA